MYSRGVDFYGGRNPDAQAVSSGDAGYGFGRMAAGIGIAGFVLLLVSGYGVVKQMDREETVIWNFG